MKSLCYQHIAQFLKNSPTFNALDFFTLCCRQIYFTFSIGVRTIDFIDYEGNERYTIYNF